MNSNIILSLPEDKSKDILLTLFVKFPKQVTKEGGDRLRFILFSHRKQINRT